MKLPPKKVSVIIIGAFCLFIPCFLFQPFFSTRVLLNKYASLPRPPDITISCPLNGSVFPPDMASPTFRWSYEGPAPDRWVISLRFGDTGGLMNIVVRQSLWKPLRKEWEEVKRRSREREAHGVIIGIRKGVRKRIGYSGAFTFSTSKDSVTNPLFYREVILPFSDAVRDPSRIRWRFGSIAEEKTPPVVLENLPVCGNCHSFSSNGKILGMDVDYANDKGGYVLTAVEREINLTPRDIITWSDYKRDEKNPTFGLLSQVSPDGRFVVSTVKDRSVFVARPELFFSQLFFPIQGILAVYSRDTKKIQSLPGADDPMLVQSNPSWSPDGKFLVFARSPIYRLKKIRNKTDVLLSPQECSEFLSHRELFKYDLYRVPFNNGKGGIAEPLRGASGNNMSNFFARYSPDDKWIVFCQSKSFMLLQPDSKLFIIPASGGTPRLMRCNTDRMNSWHSWSSNSRWLVFSSKTNSPYTQLFITHIDEQGNDAPPVLLENLTSPDRAANIPEFVYNKPQSIARIQERFIDDFSLWRAGKAFEDAGDMENAAIKYARALERNPDNVKALVSYGGILVNRGNTEEAMARFEHAIRLDSTSAQALINAGNILYAKGDFPKAIKRYTAALRFEPDNYFAEYNLGQLYLKRGNYAEALPHYRAALALAPDDGLNHIGLGKTCLRLGRIGEGIDELTKGVSFYPNDPDAHRLLAEALLMRGGRAEAIAYYRKTLERIPASEKLRVYLANLLRQENDNREARQLYEEALRIRPDFKEARDSLAAMGEE